MAENIYPVSILAIKLSFLSLYHRIFPLPWMQRLSILVASFVIGYTIAHILTNIFQCVPIKAAWDPTVNAKCIDYNAQLVAIAIINVTTDVVVLILPMRPLWSLQISASHKWQLGAIFSLGAL